MTTSPGWKWDLWGLLLIRNGPYYIKGAAGTKLNTKQQRGDSLLFSTMGGSGGGMCTAAAFGKSNTCTLDNASVF